MPQYVRQLIFLNNRFTTAHRQNAQTCSLDIYITISHFKLNSYMCWSTREQHYLANFVGKVKCVAIVQKHTAQSVSQNKKWCMYTCTDVLTDFLRSTPITCQWPYYTTFLNPTTNEPSVYVQGWQWNKFLTFIFQILKKNLNSILQKPWGQQTIKNTTIHF